MKLPEKDYCDECGSPLLIFHNDSDVNFYWECEDCGETMVIDEEEFIKDAISEQGDKK